MARSTAARSLDRAVELEGDDHAGADGGAVLGLEVADEALLGDVGGEGGVPGRAAAVAVEGDGVDGVLGGEREPARPVGAASCSPSAEMPPGTWSCWASSTLTTLTRSSRPLGTRDLERAPSACTPLAPSSGVTRMASSGDAWFAGAVRMLAADVQSGGSGQQACPGQCGGQGGHARACPLVSTCSRAAQRRRPSGGNVSAGHVPGRTVWAEQWGGPRGGGPRPGRRGRTPRPASVPTSRGRPDRCRAQPSRRRCSSGACGAAAPPPSGQPG